MDKKDIVKKIVDGFYQSSIDQNLLKAHEEDFKFLMWILINNSDLLEKLNSPLIDQVTKTELIDNIFGTMFTSNFIAFLKYLIKKDCFSEIDYASTYFTNLANYYKNTLIGEIFTPFKIDQKRLRTIEELFEKKLKAHVQLNENIDKSLIGGIRVQLEGKVYEYSMNSKLDDVKKTLISNIREG